MEFVILFLCTFRQAIAVARLYQASTFEQLVKGVCGKFDGLVPGFIFFLFDISGYNKFKVDSDDDVHNMFSLARSFGLEHIDVIIQTKGYGSGIGCGVADSRNGEVFPKNDGLRCDMEDQIDLLPLYCTHKSKMFLSVVWTFSITHVGQFFGGDTNEFRRILCKYAVECGFQFKYIKNDSVRITTVYGFKHCRPLLFLDGAFLKGRSKGTLLAATAKDGNQGLFPVAFTIVDVENACNWEWLLRQLFAVVDCNRMLTFVSDRNADLLQAMPTVFPTTHHEFCLLHLQMNLRDRMKYVNAKHKIGLMRKLRECAYAPIVASFNQKIKILKQCNPTVIGNFLQDLHPQH
ncbi:hypothetical protein ACSBR2_007449 [Camellia fascicularis]